MFLALLNVRALPHSSKNSFGLIAVLCIAMLTQAGAAIPPAHFQTPQDLRFELPANGNLRIENLRGGVIVELWPESYVSVSAIADGGQTSRSPAVVQRTESLLSIRLGRGPQHINLQLRIPARAHAAIVTNDGSVQVRGLPAALLVRTVSGEIRVDLPKGTSADVIADSKTGSVSSSFAAAVVNQSSRPQLQGRVGNGGAGVRLYSQAGNITLASAGDDNSRVKLWNVATGREIFTLKPGGGGAGFSFSPDGRRLLTASYDGTARLWDTATGKERATCKGHSGFVYSVALNTDAKVLASGGEDDTIRLWDVETGKEETTVKGHEGGVISVAFSPDGKTLASGGGDHVVRLWDVATLKKGGK